MNEDPHVELVPDDEALDLAHRMLDNEETQRTILEETLEKAEGGQIKEAGRTACGDGTRILGPHGRYPSSIELARCPLSRGGAWHTHVTPDEVRNPYNSIPDMVNVVYGMVDVIIVTGTQSSEAMVRSNDQETAKKRFQNVLGVEAGSPSELLQAFGDGRVVDPHGAADRVREEMGELFVRSENHYPDLDDWADEVEYGMMGASILAHELITHNASQPIKAQYIGDGVFDAFDDASGRLGTIGLPQDVSLRATIVSTAIGTVVGRVVSKALFEN